jgi:hypothetical protein
MASPHRRANQYASCNRCDTTKNLTASDSVLHGLALQARDGVSRKTLTEVVVFAMANWQQIVGNAGP